MFNAYSRCKRIVRDLESLELTASDDTEPATTDLLTALQAAQKEMSADGPVIGNLLRSLAVLESPINLFFDEVLVMAEDEQLKNARLSLLQHIANLPNGTADLSRLEGF